MAESKEDSEVRLPRQPPTFLEVFCKTSGKIRRFSAGTEAGYAATLINKKLLSGGDANCLLASGIEAVKEGEEPVNFGPNSLLVDYGSGWKLQTVIEAHGITPTPNDFWTSDGDKGGAKSTTRVRRASANDNTGSHSTSRAESPMSLVYIGKIMLAFLLIFVFGAVFTLILENLPRFILHINSSI